MLQAHGRVMIGDMHWSFEDATSHAAMIALVEGKPSLQGHYLEMLGTILG